MGLDDLVLDAPSNYRGRSTYLVYFDEVSREVDVTFDLFLGPLSHGELNDEILRKRRTPIAYVRGGNARLLTELVHYADTFSTKSDVEEVLNVLSSAK